MFFAEAPEVPWGILVEMAEMASTEFSVAVTVTVETVATAWPAVWVEMEAMVPTAELEQMQTMVSYLDHQSAKSVPT